MTGPRATGSSDPLKVPSSAQALFSNARPLPQDLWKAWVPSLTSLSSTCSRCRAREPGSNLLSPVILVSFKERH